MGTKPGNRLTDQVLFRGQGGHSRTGGIRHEDITTARFPGKLETEGIAPGEGQKNAFQLMKPVETPVFHPQMEIYLAGSLNFA
jgi:hypothetical protein